jgi:chromosome partitioning protein
VAKESGGKGRGGLFGSRRRREPEVSLGPSARDLVREEEPRAESLVTGEEDSTPDPGIESEIATKTQVQEPQIDPEPETDPREVVMSEQARVDGDQVSEDIQDAVAESESGNQGNTATEPEREPAPEPSTPETEPERFILPRVVSIANQKGGVGKTTTSVNLGASLAEQGYRVLVIDLDPQGNATTGLGINARNLESSIYDVLMTDLPLEDCIEATSLKNLFVAPATIDLAGAEIELVPAFSREMKLKRAIDAVKDDFDWIVIDCPPSLGLLTINAFAASDDVIVPIQCEYYALEGLSQLVRNVGLVQSNLNPNLKVRGIVMTMYDARTKLSDQVQQEVRSHFGSTVYRTVIPRTVRLSEAPSFGQPITVFDSLSRGAVAYRELGKEVSHGTSRRVG